MYELALRHPAVHELEHASFLVLGVLFWIQVVDSPPTRARLDPTRAVAYVVGAATVA